jgi:hypothetical protein
MAAPKKQAAPEFPQKDDRLESLSHQKNLADLYEHDYYTWTGAQAQALRERKVSGLDWDNLAEEVEDLGKAERHRLESHLESLLMHLLKWAYQPQRRSRSWSNSIEEHRFRVHRVLRDNPGLKAKLPEIFANAYDTARFAARRETALNLSTFPESCRWSLDDTMRSDFWPEGPPKENARRKAKPSSMNR